MMFDRNVTFKLHFLKLKDNSFKKLKLRTQSAGYAYPSWFTTFITLSCKPVTMVGYFTVYAAMVTATLTIVARFTLYNCTLKNDVIISCYMIRVEECNIFYVKLLKHTNSDHICALSILVHILRYNIL